MPSDTQQIVNKAWNFAHVLRDDGLSYMAYPFAHDEIGTRDKVNLDIFWLKDSSLEESDDLPEPDVLAREIAVDLEAALEQFSAIVEGLRE